MIWTTILFVLWNWTYQHFFFIKRGSSKSLIAPLIIDIKKFANLRLFSLVEVSNMAQFHGYEIGKGTARDPVFSLYPSVRRQLLRSQASAGGNQDEEFEIAKMQKETRKLHERGSTSSPPWSKKTPGACCKYPSMALRRIADPRRTLILQRGVVL